MFAMELFEIDDLHFFEVVILFHITAMAAAMSPFGYRCFLFKAIGSKFGPLVSSLDGRSDLFFLLCEWRWFGSLLFDFVGILAAASFAGVAFGVVPSFVCLFFDFALKEVKGLIHLIS